jgi:hypothetical protein
MADKRNKPKRPRKDSPAGKVIHVPVSESAVMAKRILNLRKKNERLRQVIDLLLDEEVNSLQM